MTTIKPPGVPNSVPENDVTDLVDEITGQIIKLLIDRRDNLTGEALHLENSAQAIVLIGLAKEYQKQFTVDEWSRIVSYGRQLGAAMRG